MIVHPPIGQSLSGNGASSSSLTASGGMSEDGNVNRISGISVIEEPEEGPLEFESVSLRTYCPA